MAVTVEASGTQTATISTEHTLSTQSGAKVLTLIVDTAAMVGGATPDITELRIYTIVLSGGTEHVAFMGSYVGVQGEPIKLSVPVPATGQTNGWKATLKQTQGTGRAFPWSVVSVG